MAAEIVLDQRGLRFFPPIPLIAQTIFHFAHNALCLPPKFCINYCCEILLRGLHIPKGISQQ